jgi:uncharacterized protein (DUF433 family)
MKYERITVDPEIVAGKPCIKGTRIAVDLILRKFGAGMSIPELLDTYPSWRVEDVLEAFTFAADVLAKAEIELASPH